MILGGPFQVGIFYNSSYGLRVLSKGQEVAVSVVQRRGAGRDTEAS